MKINAGKPRAAVAQFLPYLAVFFSSSLLPPFLPLLFLHYCLHLCLLHCFFLSLLFSLLICLLFYLLFCLLVRLLLSHLIFLPLLCHSPSVPLPLSPQSPFSPLSLSPHSSLELSCVFAALACEIEIHISYVASWPPSSYPPTSHSPPHSAGKTSKCFRATRLLHLQLTKFPFPFGSSSSSHCKSSGSHLSISSMPK